MQLYSIVGYTGLPISLDETYLHLFASCMQMQVLHYLTYILITVGSIFNELVFIV